ncbi:hypothetical protein J2W28_005155 [Variovorax boronicumulans]|uniref:hypothetical protein n=1 Tax=Variovorax boronicumulans TaxID=436515 RepID=UPI0027881087|nr:hypothetical protein [Variovorax boronicumulans]MDP9994672.1 hypothetical protein [Variovorax boronicumulans]MDQ0005986.1 hypothetical protein [Variovorax boronicumulans]
MLERRKFLTGLAGLSASGMGLGGLVACGKAEGQKMQEIKFDLGRDITETARTSGVPSFQTETVDTSVIYSINALPAVIPARYTRAGYEVAWKPLFAFTLWADKSNNSIVDHVVLQLDSGFKTHEEAQAFVEQTIAQFQNGKWQRYYNPEWDTLLTGRSSFLNEAGGIESAPMTIDPAYKILPAEWHALIKKTPTWRWVGDGVLASLGVSELGNSERGLDYRMSLEFDLLDVKLRRNKENEARELAQGDAKGWNSTAKRAEEKKASAALNKRLEANAVKRGDSVVKTP